MNRDSNIFTQAIMHLKEKEKKEKIGKVNKMSAELIFPRTPNLNLQTPVQITPYLKKYLHKFP